MTCRLLLSAFLAIAFCSAQQTNAQDLQRGLKNYQEIIGGKKKLEQLSPQEQQEVFIINKRVRNSTGSSECVCDAIIMRYPRLHWRCDLGAVAKSELCN